MHHAAMLSTDILIYFEPVHLFVLCLHCWKGDRAGPQEPSNFGPTQARQAPIRPTPASKSSSLLRKGSQAGKDWYYCSRDDESGAAGPALRGALSHSEGPKRVMPAPPKSALPSATAIKASASCCWRPLAIRRVSTA